MVITIGTKKGSDKIQHLFMIKKKNHSKLGIEGTLNKTKGISEKPINIIFNGKRPKTLLLISGTRQGPPPSSLPQDIVLDVLNRAMRQKIKGILTENRSKTLFAECMILHIENPKESTRNYQS